jgi:hypothetical protein
MHQTATQSQQSATSQPVQELDYNFRDVLNDYLNTNDSKRSLPGLDPNASDAQILRWLLKAVAINQQAELGRHAKELLHLAMLTIFKNNLLKLSTAIDKFNVSSVDALTTKLDHFIGTIEEQSEATSNQIKAMVEESKKLGRYTFWLAISTATLAGVTLILAGATCWMAWSTKIMADEAIGNMHDRGEHERLKAETDQLQQELREFRAQYSIATPRGGHGVPGLSTR